MIHPISRFFYGEHGASRDSVLLYDVGCSGGVGSDWDIFGSSFSAVGFDPLVAEIDRLTREETRGHISYKAAFVGLNSDQDAERIKYEAGLSPRLRYYGTKSAFNRSTAARAHAILAKDYVKDHFNRTAPVTYTDCRLSIDDHVKTFGHNVDILKIDTEGHDMHVLLGSQSTLRSSVLCVCVEAHLGAPVHRYANSFANIDQLLLGMGFSLFDFECWRYSRAALPTPFQLDLLAQTRTGQPIWADALYMRDLACPEQSTLFEFSVTPERIIKTACLMEKFGLVDCAVELLRDKAELLPYDIEPLLDAVVPPFLGEGIGYRDYIACFDLDPEALYPSRCGL